VDPGAFRPASAIEGWHRRRRRTLLADQALTVPSTHPDLIAILANVQLQLLSCYAAVALDRSIDKPRNLAKSVTVE